MSTWHPTRRARSRRSTRIVVGLLLPLVALAAGCGDDDDASTESGGAGDQSISVAIVEPGDGAEVGSTFEVAVDASVPIGTPDTGRHHVHLFYDGDTAEGAYDMAFGTEFTVDRLDPGEHTIEAVIANPDHSLTDARTTIDVVVGAGGPASTTTTSDGDTGYGYRIAGG